MPRPLGQHFLHDPSILDRIVDAVEPTSQTGVLEIGPGLGTLTRRLLARARRVVAIERDRALVERLRSELDPTRCHVLHHDALRVEWTDVVRAGGVDTPYPVVGNIPYYISTPLIDKAIGTPEVDRIVFLVQREVADRLAAPPGGKTYGALSVGVQSYATVQRLFPVRRGSFTPPPAVDSALVRLIPRDEPLVSMDERRAFRAFVNALFGRRRKQLGHSLRAVLSEPASWIDELLDHLGVSPRARVETLSPQSIAQIFRASSH